MDYIGIIKKAWQITLKHRYLWILGILVGGTFSQANVRLPSTAYQFSSADIQKIWPGLSNAISANLPIILVIVGLIGFLALIFMVVSIVSQAGIIEAVNRINSNQPNSFGPVFWKGFSYFWRFLALSVLLALAMSLVMVILITPIVIIISTKIYWLALLLGILFALVFIAVIIFIGLIIPYIGRIIVIENYRTFQAIRAGLQFFQIHWKQMLGILLALIILGLAYTLALLLVLAVVGTILIIPGIIIYTISQLTLLYVYAGLAGLLLFALLITLGGFYQAFINSILTLAYIDLRK